jgi:ATP-binding cassette, subfamily B, bacterial PglK
MSTYQKIHALLTPKERRRGYLLLCMILIMAFLDTVGVASIMPLMAVLGNPEIVETNRWLALAYNRFGFSEPKSFLFFLSMVVLVALVVSVTFKALTQCSLTWFTHMCNYSISCRLFEGYLNRPYAWFLNRHSADMGKSVLSEVQVVVHHVVLPFMQILAHGSVAFFMCILLVFVDPVVALIVALSIGGAYAFIYMTLRRFLPASARIGPLPTRSASRWLRRPWAGSRRLRFSAGKKPFSRSSQALLYVLSNIRSKMVLPGKCPATSWRWWLSAAFYSLRFTF